MTRIQNIMIFIGKGLDNIGVLAILLILVTTTADAIMNNVFSSPFAGATEIVSSAMPLCVFGFLLTTTIKKRHIWINLFVDMMRKELQFTAQIIVLCISIFLFGLLSYLSIPLAISSYKISECTGGTLPVPMWPAKVVLSIAIALVTIQYTIDLINLLLKPRES